jgi:putative SOS response-associated peptidase YedK
VWRVRTKARRAYADYVGTPSASGATLRCTRATPDVGEFGSFTILTGPSASRLADYHDRPPVILEPGEWAR